jgi:hypothetical protein
MRRGDQWCADADRRRVRCPLKKKPPSPVQRLLELEDQIARQSKATDELRVTDEEWTDAARQLRILKNALELIRLPGA